MSRRIRSLAAAFLCLALAIVAASCGKSANQNAKGGDADEANVKKGVKPEADAQAAVVETDYGRIVIELYPNLAPKMVERFKQLAGEGFYNGTIFHRINPGLGIIQGGDPLSKDANQANDGAGDSQYPNVPAEFSDVPFERGIVGAARKGGDVNSSNCQFFIMTKRQPAFEEPGNHYIVFGRVIEGMNNVDVIANAKTAEGTEHPAPGAEARVKSVTLVPRSNFK